MTTTESVQVVTTVATRQGTGPNNADTGTVFASENGSLAGAIIDIIGHPESAPAIGRLLAETAVRVGAQRGPFAGLLSAGLLVADPGRAHEPEPDGVGACAVVHPGGHTVISWIGDAHAYGWNGQRLHRYTTPHTYGQQLRQYGALWEVSETHNDWIVTSLAAATPATVLTVVGNDPLIILASDGVDSIPAADLGALVRAHGDDPQGLADAIVAAAREDAAGYRDDVTVVVIRAVEVG